MRGRMVFLVEGYETVLGIVGAVARKVYLVLGRR